jgi:lipopolysaccharide export system protein LptA
MLFFAMLFPAQGADMIVNADTSLEWNQKEGFYQARGNAHAYQGEQEIFADDLKAFYDATSSNRAITQIHANGNVRFADATHTGRGTSLVYQAGTSEYKLTGPNARIDGPDGNARAEKEIHFQRQQGRVRLQVAAEIKLADGRHLKGNDLQLYLSPENNIERIEAFGNVVVTQASGSSATADKLDYDRVSNKAILQGNVMVSDAGNQLSGDKAEIDFETGISKILSTTTGGRVSGRFTGTKQ